MKKWIILICVTLLASNLTVAAGASCNSAGSGSQVPNEVKRRLAMACAQAESSRFCEKQANEKKLFGENRKNFMQKCFHSTHIGDNRR